jgi:alcohol dehydrogenase class IV
MKSSAGLTHIAPGPSPTDVRSEAGCHRDIPGLLETLGVKKVLLVMGEKSFRNSDYYEALKPALADFDLTESSGVHHDPKLADVLKFISRYLNQSIDAIVGVGGGSVMDVGKALAMVLGQSRANQNALLKDLSNPAFCQSPPLPYLAVPTTAGTGSEVTPYCSFEDDSKNKFSITHPYLFPHTAFVDPLLMLSMPAYLTACTGFDALSQAIEAFWAVDRTPASDDWAIQAIPMILNSLEKVIQNPSDLKAREQMARASTRAGEAIAITKTTAVHAVSYPITTHFKVHHGHACALTLSSFIRFNAPIIEPRRLESLWKALGVRSEVAAAQRVDELMTKVKLERTLKGLGITVKGIDIIVKNGFRPDRVKNNPRPLDTAALKKMLDAIYA